MKILVLLLAALCAGLCIFILIHWRQRGLDLEEIRRQQDFYDQLMTEIAAAEEEKEGLAATNLQLQAQNDALLASTAKLQKSVEEQNVALENLVKAFSNRYAAEKENQAGRLADLESEYNKKVAEKQSSLSAKIADLEAQWESERSRYMSAIQVVQSAISEDEAAAQRHIRISEDSQEDIGFLVNTVANRLKNPDALYKLIWSEYVQKPTNEMLDFVLPQRDCPGIYKITNDRNKKAYIGRSTSVRKRLTDHIKSAVGISTIADQRIHQVMREEGLWNFTFELIEECDKDKLNEREKFYISTLQTEQLGYNQKAGG